jgi:protein PhnA
MSIERELNKRSESKCELCAATENLKVYEVLPTKKGGIDEAIMACTLVLTKSKIQARRSKSLEMFK